MNWMQEGDDGMNASFWFLIFLILWKWPVLIGKTNFTLENMFLQVVLKIYFKNIKNSHYNKKF